MEKLKETDQVSNKSFKGECEMVVENIYGEL